MIKVFWQLVQVIVQVTEILHLNVENVKGTETKENLNLYVKLTADKLIKEASLLHNDPKIVDFDTDDLIAKEAACHEICYRDFTGVVTAKKPGTIEEGNEQELDNSFDAVKDFFRDITENPDIVECKLVTDIWKRVAQKQYVWRLLKKCTEKFEKKDWKKYPKCQFY